MLPLLVTSTAPASLPTCSLTSCEAVVAVAADCSTSMEIIKIDPASRPTSSAAMLPLFRTFTAPAPVQSAPSTCCSTTPPGEGSERYCCCTWVSPKTKLHARIPEAHASAPDDAL